jgi:hypothetical protein
VAFYPALCNMTLLAPSAEDVRRLLSDALAFRGGARHRP